MRAATLDSSLLDQLGLSEAETRNPSISSSYRNAEAELPKPNQTVLDAQTRVCTGPTQTKPLTEEQAVRVLETILKSGESFIIIFSQIVLQMSCLIALSSAFELFVNFRLAFSF